MDSSAPLSRGRSTLRKPLPEQPSQCAQPDRAHCGPRSDGGMYTRLSVATGCAHCGPCLDGGLYTGRGSHSANPLRNRPPSAHDPTAPFPAVRKPQEPRSPGPRARFVPDVWPCTRSTTIAKSGVWTVLQVSFPKMMMEGGNAQTLPSWPSPGPARALNSCAPSAHVIVPPGRGRLPIAP